VQKFTITGKYWEVSWRGVHTQNAPDWGCEWLNDKYFDEKLGFLRAVEKDYMGYAG
jgi:hypothetical protein